MVAAMAESGVTPIRIELNVPERGAVRVTGLDREVVLSYHSRQDEETDRRLTVHGAEGAVNEENGAIVIDAITGYCQLRRAARTFRLNHILVASCARTGEVIADVQVWLNIPTHI